MHSWLNSRVIHCNARHSQNGTLHALHVHLLTQDVRLAAQGIGCRIHGPLAKLKRHLVIKSSERKSEINASLKIAS